MGPRPPQTESTYDLARGAISAGDAAEGVRRIRQLLDEATEGRELFPLFIERARRFLLDRGVPPAAVSDEERRILSLLGATEGRARREGGASKAPRRRAGDTDALDMLREWAAVLEVAARAERACLAGDGQAASDLVEEVRSAWMAVHDRFCDITCGLFSLAAERLGESVVGAMWDDVIGDMYPSRDAYDRDRRPWAESVALLLEDAAVSLRGHLSGPQRTGEVSLQEEQDRWVFRFDPCGSGGRTLRADANADGAARVGEPFGFRVTTGRHDWAWQTEGVCLYCVHCCQLQERASISRLGYPVRVVEPPVWGTTEPRGYCTWSVYKDPQLVPAEAYRRVGAVRSETETVARIEAVDLVPAHQVVTERLRHAIHIGTYLPGDKLPPERKLAQQLGVARMTVREAIRVLRAEGYVASQRGPAGGIIVLDQSGDEMRLRQALRHRMAELDDDFEFRIAVEGAAARLAAQRRTKR